MASIKDVARAANVGVGTASRALSGNGYVAPETRKKLKMRREHYITLQVSWPGIFCATVPELLQL